MRVWEGGVVFIVHKV